MSYEIKVREVATVTAMTIRTASNMKNIGPDTGSCYEELWEYMEKNGAKFTGECFALYHGTEFDPDHIDVECGFSVAELLPDVGRIRGRVVEGGLMVSAVHKGPYDTLPAVYDALMKWGEENGGYVLLNGWRDSYLNDPQSVPPGEILTEVLCTVRKK